MADIHISRNISRHEEYRIQFEKIYEKLKELKPDRIVIVGDLYHDFIDLEGEAEILMGDFLNNLANISKVIIVRGNHDLRKKSLNRQDVIKTITKLISNSNITYYDKTGFYEDENVIWCVHNHAEKNKFGERSNPWYDCEIPKTENKITIDLFHDPIDGCMMGNEIIINKTNMVKTSDLKGNFGMLGDIHTHQYMNKNKTIAYPSSIIQQNFGEDIDNHGFILWNLIMKNSTFYQLDSDYTLVNVHIFENSDYDNLRIIEEIKPNSSIKIHWTEYAAHLTIENEQKIINFIKNKYKIEEIKFEKTTLYKDLFSSKLLSERIDISNPQNQRDLFVEYLTAKQYNEEQINQILEIDDIINERLEYREFNNIQWTIDNIWFNNFKTYGDGNKIPWSDKNGIIQITGENREGKSTLIDVICYILYGTTLYTNKLGGAKIEKNGEARFINNKRDLDYCEAGLDLIIDSVCFKLKRKTERKWDNKGNIKSAATVIDYLDSFGKLLNDETKDKTQKLINETLGTFDDFIRQVLTNSDNINSMFSISRADFLDSLIRDAGYDIFDKKLEEFKKYQKELNEEKIVVNLQEDTERISSIKDENNILTQTLQNNINLIKESKNLISIKNKEKEDIMSSLYHIDEEIETLDMNKCKDLLDNYKIIIQSKISEIFSNEEKMKKLKSSYDEEKLENFKKKSMDFNQDILTLKVKIKDVDFSIEGQKNLIDKYDTEIKTFKDKTKLEIQSKIKEVENEKKISTSKINTYIEEAKKELEFQIKDIENNISAINVQLKNIKEQGVEIKKEIEELKNSKECPTCKRVFNNIEQVESHIEEKQTEINNLFKKVKPLQQKSNDLESDKKVFLLKLDQIDQKEYIEFPIILEGKHQIETEIEKLQHKIEKYNSIIENINSGDYSKVEILQNKILEQLQLKSKAFDKIKNFKENKSEIETKIETIEYQKKDLETEILIIERDKLEYKTYRSLYDSNQEIKLENEKHKLNIEKFQTKLIRYNEQVKFIEENKIKKENIEELRNVIIEQEDIVKGMEHINKNNEINITINSDKIKNIESKIEKFYLQEKKNQLYKEYISCLDRDGIPSFLLKKSLDVINNKLRDLLSEIDFMVYFNEDLQLKMKDGETLINILEGSGSERTFASVILKIALRSINTRSKPDFIFYDEIFGKLKGKYVELMKGVLSSIKKQINKVVIIEHKESIAFDYIIEVSKNEKNIAKLEIN